MVWVRLEDRFAEHPKLLSVHVEARWAHVAALCYCGRNETEGFIPAAVAPPCAAALVDAGLWEPCTGGYRIHDFLDYNPTKAEIEETRRARSEAGARGAAARWGKARPMAKRMASAMANPCDSDAPSPSPSPDPVPEPSTRSSANADARALLVQRIWNDNRGPLPKCEALNTSRTKRLAALAREANDDESLLASTVAAFASDPFIREKRFGIDTLTRAEHRPKWLDLGRNGHGSNGNHKSLLDRLVDGD